MGFFCAHNHTEHFQDKASAVEEFYKELDFEFLKRSANAVLAMPNWEKSLGARREIEWAKQQKDLPIFYPKSPDDISEIVRWAKQ